MNQCFVKGCDVDASNMIDFTIAGLPDYRYYCNSHYGHGVKCHEAMLQDGKRVFLTSQVVAAEKKLEHAKKELSDFIQATTQ